jgi:hypothetical protein
LLCWHAGPRFTNLVRPFTVLGVSQAASLAPRETLGDDFGGIFEPF